MATQDWQTFLNKVLESVNSNWQENKQKLGPDDEKKLDTLRGKIVSPPSSEGGSVGNIPHDEGLEFLKNHSYKDNKWLQQFIKSIPQPGIGGFKILTKEKLKKFDDVYKKLKDKRPKYETNEQWFKDFTAEEIKSLDQADQFKEQYEQIKAPIPGSVKDLSSIYNDRHEAKLSTKLLSTIFGGDGGGIVRSGPGFKSSYSKSKKDKAKAWKKMKRAASGAHEAFKSRGKPGSGGGGSAGTPAKKTTPAKSSTAPAAAPSAGGPPAETAPTAQVASSVETDESVEEATIERDKDGTPRIKPTGGKKSKSGKPLVPSKAMGAKRPSIPPTKAGARGSGIEKDDKTGVVIKGYIGSDGREHSLDEIFGGGGAGGRGGGAGGSARYAAGAGFASQGDGAGGEDGEGGGGLMDLVDQYRRNKKDKEKKKKKKKKKSSKKKPRGKPRPKPRGKPKGKLSRLLRGGKNLLKGPRIASMAARVGSLGSTIATVGGTSVSTIAAGGAAATAGVVAAAAAAGYIGWKVGSYIDKKLDVSGKASDALTNMGDTGKMKRSLEQSNKDAAALSKKYQGKKQYRKMPSGKKRRTQIGWDKQFDMYKGWIKQGEIDYKNSKSHGMWSSDADKENEKDKKRSLDNWKRTQSKLKKQYAVWKKEGGDSYKEPVKKAGPGSSPALAKAKATRDKLIQKASMKNYSTLDELAERAALIKKANDEYTAAKGAQAEAEDKKKKSATSVGDIAMPPTGSKAGRASRYISGPEGMFKLSPKDGILAASGLGGLAGMLGGGSRTSKSRRSRDKEPSWWDKMKDKLGIKKKEKTLGSLTLTDLSKETKNKPIHVKGLKVDGADKARFEMQKKELEAHKATGTKMRSKKYRAGVDAWNAAGRETGHNRKKMQAAMDAAEKKVQAEYDAKTKRMKEDMGLERRTQPLVDKLRMKNAGLGAFKASSSGGAMEALLSGLGVGAGGGRRRMTAKQRMLSSKAASQGSSGDEVAMAEGVRKGQEKFITGSVASGGKSIFGRLVSLTSSMMDPKKNAMASRTQLVKISEVTPKSIAQDIDRSVKIIQMAGDLKHMRENGIKVIGAAKGAEEEEGAMIIPSGPAEGANAMVALPGSGTQGMQANPTDNLRAANGGLPA
jgi:hypothetical protein